MPTPSPPEDDLAERIARVEDYLEQGYYPKGRKPPSGQVGALRKAALDYNVSVGGTQSWIDVAERTLGRKVDWGKWKKPAVPELSAPPGYRVKGTSTLVDPATGEEKLQWIKIDADAEEQKRLFDEAVQAMAKRVPRAKPVKAPQQGMAALCNLYTVTDYHMGMLAWHREGGADWDIGIARKMLTDAFSHMIASSPNAETAVIAQLGDFLHSDGMEPLTPASKNVLDVDGRFSKIVDATILTLRAVIDMALAKHKKVHLIMAEGNHDPVSSIWLRQMFRHMYENEPRLTVNDSELPYYAYRHGKVMLAFHHGHIRKIDDLPGVFAAQFSEMWGRTEYRDAHCGHEHHAQENEKNGMRVIRHPTLAAKDAHTARGQWHAIRRAIAITYHENFGEVGRNYVTPEMLA